ITDITFGSEKGQGYAIPSLMARTVIGELQRDGTYDRGYVGVTVKYVDADTKAKYGLTRSDGMVVNYVIPGTPAETAGIKPGDVVLGINGRATGSSYLLQEAVSSVGPAMAIVLNVERGGKPTEIKVTTALRPAAPRIDPVAELEGYLRIRFDEDPKMGTVIIRDPFRSRHSPGLYDGSVVKSVVPGGDWPETDLNLNWYRTRAKPFPVHSRADLARALERSHVGGRMAAAFDTDFVFAPIAAVAFDELWAFIL
ncbi:MAG TPA: PDZ domain-containing protein, partial [Dongiaceae bacterium]|nr:PDZ domain-containing protein [Dongiaceae bacterium]